jgi:hypothetical protein
MLLAALLCSAAPVYSQEQAPAGEKPQEKPAEKRSDGPYRLRPGDEVTVSVLPQKTYSSGPSEILPDGSLYLQFVGKIQADGMTVDDLKARVEKALKEVHRLRSPSVVIIPKQAPPPPPEVEKPVKLGRLPLPAPSSTRGRWSWTPVSASARRSIWPAALRRTLTWPTSRSCTRASAGPRSISRRWRRS